MVLSPEVWDVIQDHADFLSRIRTTTDQVVTTDLLARVLELDEVLIANALQDNNQEGAADDLDYIFGKNVLLAYAAPNPGLMQPSAGYTFAWTGMFGSNAAGMRMKRFRMEAKASDRVEGESAYDHKLVAAECGAFFTNVIS